MSRRRASVTGFKQALARSAGVICNSGFELISECLQWDKPVLTKPLQGQMEQHSNALALAQLGYARSTDIIDAGVLEDWLKRPSAAASIRFPNVAEALANWLVTGCSTPPSTIGRRLWQQQEMSSATPIESDVEIATLSPSVSV